MISTFTAFFDANAFYGARLRSLIVELAQTKLFRARWSEHVHDEWTRNLLRNRPDLSAMGLDRTRRAMDTAVLDCLVTGYAGLIENLTLPDPDDRHVLAAAIIGRASCIVPFNLMHFPSNYLESFNLRAVHPGDFLLDTESMDPAAFAGAMIRDFQHYQSPPLAFADYVTSLSNAGVPRAAAEIKKLDVLLKP